MMDTQGPPPVTLPPEGIRDRQPKRDQRRFRKPSGNAHKTSPDDRDTAEGEGFMEEEQQQLSRQRAPKQADQGTQIDIRI